VDGVSEVPTLIVGVALLTVRPDSDPLLGAKFVEPLYDPVTEYVPTVKEQ
jgi:hypothetical protein